MWPQKWLYEIRRSLMLRIGVRELKNQATAILRDVRENRTEYIVTYRGRPVAVLLPIDESWLEAEMQRAIATVTPKEEVWAELDTLRGEIDHYWQSEKTAVALITEQRR
ncbi:MAG: type II toxin-antitoxin system Phd/YefM family antitoxin [Nitrospinota bacterium]|nr:MAG: type II toxin-antitoxin system Phd/YefM family antitoxin [Nitrospinota bacterium]